MNIKRIKVNITRYSEATLKSAVKEFASVSFKTLVKFLEVIWKPELYKVFQKRTIYKTLFKFKNYDSYAVNDLLTDDYFEERIKLALIYFRLASLGSHFIKKRAFSCFYPNINSFVYDYEHFAEHANLYMGNLAVNYLLVIKKSDDITAIHNNALKFHIKSKNIKYKPTFKFDLVDYSQSNIDNAIRSFRELSLFEIFLIANYAFNRDFSIQFYHSRYDDNHRNAMKESTNAIIFLRLLAINDPGLFHNNLLFNGHAHNVMKHTKDIHSILKNPNQIENMAVFLFVFYLIEHDLVVKEAKKQYLDQVVIE